MTLTGIANLAVAQPLTEQQVSRMVGQRIILDMRYFCEQVSKGQTCQTPVTELPEALKTLLVEHNIGGVILFSENIKSPLQLVELNFSLQSAMIEAGKPPLIIAVDQEGGRVARLPSEMLTSFAGNLAIGATFHRHGSAFAQNVSQGIARVLRPLGINTNFAPSVDINSEPRNPVINVRSFGENPEQVAALGEAFVAGLQHEGVISAIKHFPGHGDTHVDSHSGLPQVTHTAKQANRGDLLPFRQIINSATPAAMVMSAHIQYPSLDDSQITDVHGRSQTVPATLSRKILHTLLRDQMRYKGVVVTDALDMAGIAKFFSKEEATLRAFQAGADIALMPYTIRSSQDIAGFKQFFDNVVTRIKLGEVKADEMRLTAQRITQLKNTFSLREYYEKGLAWWQNEIQDRQFHARNQDIEKALSLAATTLLYGGEKLPVSDKKWLAVMPDSVRCYALNNAVAALTPDTELACIPLTVLPAKQTIKRLMAQANVLLVGDITPLHAVYEMANFDSPSDVKKRINQTARHGFIMSLMKTAKKQHKKVIFAPLRMPYIAQTFQPVSDIGIATFSYNVGYQPGMVDSVHSAAIDALVRTLIGTNVASGASPVKWQPPLHHKPET
ncbi:beta-hexosaminidase [Alteromonas sp. 345S023]|uniref:beta-N-acetylhexosaminidase n=2 Tax=Alteromonas profundi TaxID=2696062 RepID=A0A7X5LP73_9ALTE|nr:beta-hexosaminidase [Alteromonas profundi]